MTLEEDYEGGLSAKLWTQDREYMGEITWEADSIAGILFTEES